MLEIISAAPTEQKHHFIIRFCELVAGFHHVVLSPAERPLHHSEKILEQVLEWSSLESPGLAFLVLKKFPPVQNKGRKPPTCTPLLGIFL